MKSDLKQLSNMFDILSNDVRLCILVNLCQNKEKNVGDLQTCANTSQSFISQQLSKLKAMGIIESRKVGNEVYYSIKNEEIRGVINSLKIGGTYEQ